MNEPNIMQEALDLVYGERQETYGHPLDNYQPTAEMMRAYIKARYGVDIPMDYTDVCRFFQFAKISREATGQGFARGYLDNEVDIIGYSGVRQLCHDEDQRRKDVE